MARNPGVESLMRFLKPNPNLPPELAKISAACEVLAENILNSIPVDSPELTTGLRKLLEAKDCFVRAALERKLS